MGYKDSLIGSNGLQNGIPPLESGMRWNSDGIMGEYCSGVQKMGNLSLLLLSFSRGPRNGNG